MGVKSNIVCKEMYISEPETFLFRVNRMTCFIERLLEKPMICRLDVTVCTHSLCVTALCLTSTL